MFYTMNVILICGCQNAAAIFSIRSVCPTLRARDLLECLTFIATSSLEWPSFFRGVSVCRNKDQTEAAQSGKDNMRDDLTERQTYILRTSKARPEMGNMRAYPTYKVVGNIVRSTRQT